LDYQSRRFNLTGQIDRRRSAQRFSEDDYVVWRNAARFCQIVPRRSSIQIQALLGRLAFAPAVASIVDDEHVDWQIHHPANHVVPISDVARVAVKPQQYHLCANRRRHTAGLAVRGAEPAVKPQRVARFKVALFYLWDDRSVAG